MNSPYISVIIPVYNGQRFIEDCLDSVFSQQFDDLEVIVVDDGSTDDTGEILGEYSQKEERLRVISQANAGQGAARNKAIRAANGKYIAFVDADDLLDEDALTRIAQALEDDKSDLVFFELKFFKDLPDGSRAYKYLEKPPFIDEKELIGAECDRLLQVKNFYCTNGVYKKDFLLDNDIKFGEGYIYEDAVFVVHVANCAEQVKIIDTPLYLYRESNDESTSRSGYEDNRHSDGFVRAIHDCLAVLTPRTDRTAYDLLKYFVTKTIIYYERRVPARHRNEFIKRVVDELSGFKVALPEVVFDADKIVKLCIRLGVFTRRRYGLFKTIIGLKIWQYNVTQRIKHRNG